MLDASQVQASLREDGIIQKQAEVEAVLATIDQAAIFAEVRHEYRVEIWDKKSAINGVEAGVFLERPDVGEGEAYLLYKGDVLQFFQPSDPHQPGFVQMPDAEKVGNKHADMCAEADADRETLRLARQAFDGTV